MKKEIKNKVAQMMKVFEDLSDSRGFHEVFYDISKKEKLPKFIFAGIGKNWYICEKVVKTYISMGLDAEALDCTHAIHGDIGMLGTNPDEEKYIFFISKSGTTEEMIRLVKIINKLKDCGILKNIKTIGFSLNNNISKEEYQYDFLIVPEKFKKEESGFEFDERNLVPSLSINIMQLLLDMLGVEIYESKPTLVENYKYNHLAGANGKKLGGDLFLENL